MNAEAYIPSTAPFTIEQRAWLNGFLAGALCPAPGPSPAAEKAPRETKPLLILYGSQTGSAERLARGLGKEAAEHGFAARVLEANGYATVDWKAETRVLVVTSTWGDGEPPDNAAAFWTFLSSSDAPDFSHLSFAVLALGDKSYSDFCGAGRKFDERLEKLGAKRLIARTDCDLDYEGPARAWSDSLWRTLATENPAAEKRRVGESEEGQLAARALPGSPAFEHPAAAAEPYSRANPFPARLIVSRNLNGSGSIKETRHVEISLEGSNLTYAPGDALGVLPTNCAALVSDILAALGCDGEEGVKAPNGAETSLRTALLRYYQITHPSAAFLQAVAERESGTDEPNSLKALLAPENKSTLEKHLHGRDLLDFLLVHPKARFAPADFVALLRPLNPRLYSIASSVKAHPGQVHLCVGVVRYETHGRKRKGVCSTFLADRADTQTPVPVFVQTAHGFRLPASPETPVIMVGPGTGIAPFRAFLEERRMTGATGRNWLFFGDQKQSTDFLYRDEIEGALNDGLLGRLSLAFSRDQQEKIYVQHRMVEEARELFAWLEEGAHFYVCGDAKRMAKDVDAALHQVVQRGGDRTAEQAVEYVVNLKSTKRYQRDVY